MISSPKKAELHKSTEQYATKPPQRIKSRSNRLSKRLLHDLRNRIPVQALIENELGLQHHTESGVFRFECPFCTSFHTSIKTTTNLARCFDCKINFNPIDMVMAVRKTDFLQSARFLVPLLKSGVIKRTDTKGTGPAHNREIPASLHRMASSELNPLSSILRSPPAGNVSEALPDQKAIEHRIQRLEKEIDGLKHRLDQLHQFIVREFSKNDGWRTS